MIVCHCGVVSDREVTTAVEAGARSLADVCRETGAGRNCGACILSVKRLLCQHRPSPTDAPPEVEYAAS
jgi:bacterioferritin-associated ferredoxin